MDLSRALAGQEYRRCWFVPMPRQLIYWLLRRGQFMRLRLPFRADWVLGLIHTVPVSLAQTSWLGSVSPGMRLL
jgi:hypothetical protein